MRPLEALLLATDLLALLVLVIRSPGRARHLRRLALAPLPVLAAQVLIEGQRWQLVPAYVLTGLLALAWLVRPGRAGRYVTGVAAGLGVLGLLASAALPVAVPVFRIPEPTGPYDVGTVTHHWVDTARPEAFTADPDDRRELMVQVWYPAEADPSAPRAPYVEDGALLAPLARLMGLPEATLGYLEHVTTNAVQGAPMAGGGQRYPVLIFSHGRGGYRGHNTAQVEELVSHGYVVAAIDHPYAAAGVVFPDGRLVGMDPRMLDRAFIDRVIPYLAQDASFTLDLLATLDRADPEGRFTGRLDLEHTGIFGVSLGGAVAAQSCLRDPRFDACLPVDVFMPADVVAEGLDQPVMWISRDAATMRREGWTTDAEETHETMRAVFDRLPGAGCIVLVPGMFHVDFSDFPLFSPLAQPLGLRGTVDAERTHAILGAYSLAFFDEHLKGRPSPLLDGPSPHFPEVLLETR